MQQFDPLKLPTAAVFSCCTGDQELSDPLCKLVSGRRFQLPLLGFPDSQPKPRSALTQGVAISLAFCLRLSPLTHSPEATRKIQGRLTFPQSHFALISPEPLQPSPPLPLPFLAHKGHGRCSLAWSPLSHCKLGLWPALLPNGFVQPSSSANPPATVVYRVPARHAQHQAASAYVLVTKCTHQSSHNEWCFWCPAQVQPRAGP